MPFFDISKPKVYYADSYAAAAFKRVQRAYVACKNNLGDAAEAREQYYNKKTQERTFSPGDRVMVHFAKTPTGINHKFYKKWRYFTIIKPVGPVNVLVKENPKKKPILVHVNRVQHATAGDIREACDSVQVPYEGQEPDCEQDTGETPDQLPRQQDESSDEDDGAIGYYLRSKTAFRQRNEGAAGGRPVNEGASGSGADRRIILDADNIFDQLSESPVTDEQAVGPDQRRPAEEEQGYDNWLRDPWNRVARNFWPAAAAANDNTPRVNTRARSRAQGEEIDDSILVPKTPLEYKKRRRNEREHE